MLSCLAGHFFLRARAVIVRPDDLVEEAFAPEDLIQQHLAVMHLAVINVKVQAAIGGQNAFGFDQARLEECQEIVKDIAVGFEANLGRGIALPGKASAVARLRSARCVTACAPAPCPC